MKLIKPLNDSSGIKESIESSDNISYYNALTLDKLNNALHTIFQNRIDVPIRHVIHTGYIGILICMMLLKLIIH